MTATAARLATGIDRTKHTLRWVILGGVIITVFSMPVLAQGSGSAFCTTDMADTIRNLFSVIQFGGPLVGGLLALGAAVATPMVRRSDLKQELKEVRNQGIVWGVIVAPLGTVIIQFLLTSVVAGGASCAF